MGALDLCVLEITTPWAEPRETQSVRHPGWWELCLSREELAATVGCHVYLSHLLLLGTPTPPVALGVYYAAGLCS